MTLHQGPHFKKTTKHAAGLGKWVAMIRNGLSRNSVAGGSMKAKFLIFALMLAFLGATALSAQITATPVIALATGSYSMPTSTTITDSTSGASILWCTIASGICTPSTSYAASVGVDTGTVETLCANATASGYSTSPLVCQTYANNDITATPVITLAAGTYAMPTGTTITDSTSGASIQWCYIPSGTCTPTTSYSASIYLDPAAAETICANATASSLYTSLTVCQTYTNGSGPTTATPSITLTSGTYLMPTSTTITESISGASIFWCVTNGSTCPPATPYTGAVSVYTNAFETICANATASGYTTSSTACQTYTTGATPTTANPTIALVTGSYPMPTSTTITDSNPEASILWCVVGSGYCSPATPYTTFINVDTATTETICANATAPGYNTSANICQIYTNPQVTSSGTGTTGMVPVFTGPSTLGNSPISVSGTNVGIGTTAPAYSLDVTGVMRAQAGIVFPGSTTPQTTPWTGVLCGGDYAEAVNATGPIRIYEPGDVLVIGDGDNGEVQKSAEPYSTMVAGIFATKPGVIGRRQSLSKESQEIPMAMIGIVPTKVTTENGPIHRGDLLVTASTVGFAMKGTDRSRLVGAVIGKAMGILETGTGVIEVLVTLQ